jgi:hypothetical protein
MKYILLSITLFFNFYSYSQSSYGFFGKKNFIDLSFNLHSNYFVKRSSYTSQYTGILTNSYYVKDGVSLKQKTVKPIACEYTVNIGRQIRRNFAISIYSKLGLYNNINSYNLRNYIYESISYTENANNLSVNAVQSTNYSHLTLLPMISFGGNGLSSPIGVFIKFGVGPTIYKIKDVNSILYQHSAYTNFVTNETTPSGVSSFNSGIADFRKIGLTVLAGLDIRKEISKRLAINFGFSAHYNRSEELNVYGYAETLKETIKHEVADEINSRFFSTNIGLSYIF